MICEECGTDEQEQVTIARGENVSFKDMCQYLPTVMRLLEIENKSINLIPIIFSERNGEGTNILVVLDDEGTHIIQLDLLDKEIEKNLLH